MASSFHKRTPNADVESAQLLDRRFRFSSVRAGFETRNPLATDERKEQVAVSDGFYRSQL